MTFCVSLSKQRAKFSAAHFTIFDDGSVERLHGHNYAVGVDFYGEQLSNGLLFPFSIAKKHIQCLCDAWDERVLIPSDSVFVQVLTEDGQTLVHLKTSKVNKRYAFPSEDVLVLPITNTSSEELARHFSRLLKEKIAGDLSNVTRFDVHISESPGQSVGVTCDLSESGDSAVIQSI